MFNHIDPDHVNDFIEELHTHVSKQDRINLSDFIQVNTSNLILSNSHLLTFLGLQNFGETVSGEELHEILKEIDSNMNGQVELDEYLQVLKNLVLTINFLELY